MKLNAEIIYDNLKDDFQITLVGNHCQTLHLSRPEYYLDSAEPFLSNHLYIVNGEQLPAYPTIEPDAVILCIGDSIYLPYYIEHSCVIQFQSSVNHHIIFNRLTALYNKYDNWDEAVNELLFSHGNIQEIIDCSHDIFENPMYVLNANFYYIAHSDHLHTKPNKREKSLAAAKTENVLALSAVKKFGGLRKPSMEEHSPLFFDLPGSNTLNVNLFDEHEYIGCLCIDYQYREYRESDKTLVSYLARKIECAFAWYSDTADFNKYTLRQALLDIVTNGCINTEFQWVLDTIQFHEEYICIQVRFADRLARFPVKYLSHTLEKMLPECIAFEYENAVVAFFRARAMNGNEQSCPQWLKERIAATMDSPYFDVGISNSFHDICDARLYYLQTCSALKYGKTLSPQNHFHLFQNYALAELVTNALGKTPIDVFFTEGFRKLIEHDKNASVSYVETLSAYLENNMSISKTASDLYLNRSTLLERITRIKRLLGTDLQNADEKLHLQILLKAMHVQKQLLETLK